MLQNGATSHFNTLRRTSTKTKDNERQLAMSLEK